MPRISRVNTARAMTQLGAPGRQPTCMFCSVSNAEVTEPGDRRKPDAIHEIACPEDRTCRLLLAETLKRKLAEVDYYYIRRKYSNISCAFKSLLTPLFMRQFQK